MENHQLSYKVIIGNSSKMIEIPDRSIHLIITSPPYPMIEMWDGLFSKANHEIGEYLDSGDQSDIQKAYELMHSELSKTFRECTRVLIDGGICCINVGDAVRKIGGVFQLFPNHSRITSQLEELGLTILPYILWKKPTNKPNAFLGSGFLPTNAYVTLDCEFILLARKGGPRKFKPKDPNRYQSNFSKDDRDRWFSQIWNEIPGASQEPESGDGRSAAFPIEIPRRLIKMFSVKGDVVLDPFMGTGTTLLAARETERSFVGYEIDKNNISPNLLMNSADIETIERDEDAQN